MSAVGDVQVMILQVIHPEQFFQHVAQPHPGVANRALLGGRQVARVGIPRTESEVEGGEQCHRAALVHTTHRRSDCSTRHAHAGRNRSFGSNGMSRSEGLQPRVRRGAVRPYGHLLTELAALVRPTARRRSDVVQNHFRGTHDEAECLHAGAGAALPGRRAADEMDRPRCSDVLVEQWLTPLLDRPQRLRLGLVL